MDIPYASPNRYNEDLAPVVDLKWGASRTFNVLTSDVHSPWSYYLAASLSLLCGGFLNFIVAPGAGVLFSYVLPDFSSVLPPWWDMVDGFCGLAIAAALCFVLATMVPKPVRQTT